MRLRDIIKEIKINPKLEITLSERGYYGTIFNPLSPGEYFVEEGDGYWWVSFGVGIYDYDERDISYSDEDINNHKQFTESLHKLGLKDIQQEEDIDSSEVIWRIGIPQKYVVIKNPLNENQSFLIPLKPYNKNTYTTDCNRKQFRVFVKALGLSPNNFRIIGHDGDIDEIVQMLNQHNIPFENPDYDIVEIPKEYFKIEN